MTGTYSTDEITPLASHRHSCSYHIFIQHICALMYSYKLLLILKYYMQ